MTSKLKRYLAARRISSYWLQQKTGLSYNTIYRLMRVDGVGTLDTWLRVSDALGCTIEEIVGFEEDDDGGDN